MLNKSYFTCFSIGLSIAKRFAKDGASVVISSRKQKNVDRAVKEIKEEGGKVFGMVCHVGKKEDRDKMIEAVIVSYFYKKSISKSVRSFDIGSSIDLLHSFFHNSYFIKCTLLANLGS